MLKLLSNAKICKNSQLPVVRIYERKKSLKIKSRKYMTITKSIKHHLLGSQDGKLLFHITYAINQCLSFSVEDIFLRLFC